MAVVESTDKLLVQHEDAGATLHTVEPVLISQVLSNLGIQQSVLAAGAKIVGGVATLDGSGATPVTTGLTTILAAVAVIQLGTAPGVGTSVLTVTFSGGTLSIWPWKVTGTGDATLIASTGTEVVHWIAIGV